MLPKVGEKRMAKDFKPKQKKAKRVKLLVLGQKENQYIKNDSTQNDKLNKAIKEWRNGINLSEELIKNREKIKHSIQGVIVNSDTNKIKIVLRKISTKRLDTMGHKAYST